MFLVVTNKSQNPLFSLLDFVTFIVVFNKWKPECFGDVLILITVISFIFDEH